MNKRLVFGLLIAAALACIRPASADDYPSRPIRILVPYEPGGVSDIAARLVGQKLTEALGQQVYVENRPGGNGFIAVMATVRAPPRSWSGPSVSSPSIRPFTKTFPTMSSVI
jgi:tripartite-type tricarboxylate transporter receptor subunit TctC